MSYFNLHYIVPVGDDLSEVIFRKVISRLKKSTFFRNVFILATGTGFAQLIAIAITPILTRLYTPADFGALALFTGIVSVVSVIATARYELAIMLPKDDEDAIDLTALSIIIAFSLSLISFGVTLLFRPQISRFFGQNDLNLMVYLLPISFLFAGIYQAMNWWTNRKRQYKRIASAGIVQTVSTTTVQVLVGTFTSFGAVGLIIGTMIGSLDSSSYLLSKFWNENRKSIPFLTKDRIQKNAALYSKFPKYSMIGALANCAASQMPVFLLNSYFTAQITGIFSLTFRALSLPMSLVTAAISQVLFERVVSIHNQNPSMVRPYILKVAGVLTLLMVPFILICWYLGEGIFVFAFGEAWRQAGQFAAVLSFAVAIRFVVSPLSAVLALEHNIRFGVVWQIFYFFSITTTLYIFRGAEIGLFFRIFVVHELALYSLHFIFILVGTKNMSKAQLLDQFEENK